MKKINPTRDFVILAKPEMKSGIALPDGVSVNREGFYIVIAKGPQVKAIEIGDRVVPIGQGMLPFKVEGKDCFAIKEEFIISVIVEDTI